MVIFTFRNNNIFGSHYFALLLVNVKERRITLVVYLQYNGSKFCTKRDTAGINKDVKQTVIRCNSLAVTRVSIKRDFTYRIYQVLHD